MGYKKLKRYIMDNYQGKRIEEKTLRHYMQLEEYNDYYRIMLQLIDGKIIRPIKSSGGNGRNPVLHKRYQGIRVRENIDIKVYLNEIRTLHPCFNVEGYLSNTNRYLKERSIILQLNEFFREKPIQLEEPASINERSFQVFGLEKLISSDSTFRSIVGFNDDLLSFLNMYNTPEPFFEYIINDDIDANEINILIIENKDTWYSLRKIMNKETNKLYGVHFDCLLYGEGKKITRRKDSLTEYTHTNYGNNVDVKYYYFGDLDMEGIGIFESLIKSNYDLNIFLMKELYLDMLNESRGVKLPKTKELQQSNEGKAFFEYFSEIETKEIIELLNSGSYIPQEILTYGFFKKKIEGGI